MSIFHVIQTTNVLSGHLKTQHALCLIPLLSEDVPSRYFTYLYTCVRAIQILTSPCAQKTLKSWTGRLVSFSRAPRARLPRGWFWPTFIWVHVKVNINIRIQKTFWISLILGYAEFNNEIRNRMLGLLQNGMTQKDTARRYDVHRSTVSRLIRRYKATGSVSDRPRPGGTRATTRRQDIYIHQRHLRNRKF